MALNPRMMLGLGGAARRPSMQFQQLNPAFQSDPRRILGQTLMGQGTSTAPVRTPLQGLGRLSSALVGAYLQRQAGDEQVRREDKARDALLASLPADASPMLRNLAQTAPGMLQSALATSAVQPTTTAFTQNIEGTPGAVGYGTKTINPLTGAESTSFSGIYKPTKPAKQDFVTLTKADGTEPRTLPLGDPQIGTLLGQGYVERQGGGTNVSVNMPGAQEGEFRKATAKAASKTITDLQEQVRGEADLITRLNIADNLLEAGTDTGPIANLTMPIRNIGKALGFLNDEQARELNNQQVLTAAFNYVIPRMRVVGSGATSDFEARLFSSATANMANTPQANKVLVKSMQALVDRRQNLLQAMEKYADENNDLIGFAKFADENVPPALKAYMTDEEFDAAIQPDANGNVELKVGDLYYNGKTGTFEIYEVN